MIESNHLHRLKLGDRNLTLIGTAHVSRESAQLVRDVIEGERPDTVAVELCEARYRSITETDGEERQSALPPFGQGEFVSALLQRSLGFVQRKIGRKLDVNPGEEMLQAIRSAEIVGARVYLADRDVRTTLSRVWTGMRRLAKFKLSLQLLVSLSEVGRIKAEDVEAMKNENTLEKSLAQINRSFPEITRIVIDERDQYLAYRLRTAPGRDIVAVVGAGHVPGIRKYLQWEWSRLIDALGDQVDGNRAGSPPYWEDALSNI